MPDPDSGLPQEEENRLWGEVEELLAPSRRDRVAEHALDAEGELENEHTWLQLRVDVGGMTEADATAEWQSKVHAASRRYQRDATYKLGTEWDDRIMELLPNWQKAQDISNGKIWGDGSRIPGVEEFEQLRKKQLDQIADEDYKVLTQQVSDRLIQARVFYPDEEKDREWLEHGPEWDPAESNRARGEEFYETMMWYEKWSRMPTKNTVITDPATGERDTVVGTHDMYQASGWGRREDVQFQTEESTERLERFAKALRGEKLSKTDQRWLRDDLKDVKSFRQNWEEFVEPGYTDWKLHLEETRAGGPLMVHLAAAAGVLGAGVEGMTAGYVQPEAIGQWIGEMIVGESPYAMNSDKAMKHYSEGVQSALKFSASGLHLAGAIVPIGRIGQGVNLVKGGAKLPQALKGMISLGLFSAISMPEMEGEQWMDRFRDSWTDGKHLWGRGAAGASGAAFGLLAPGVGHAIYSKMLMMPEAARAAFAESASFAITQYAITNGHASIQEGKFVFDAMTMEDLASAGIFGAVMGYKGRASGPRETYERRMDESTGKHRNVLVIKGSAGKKFLGKEAADRAQALGKDKAIEQGFLKERPDGSVEVVPIKNVKEYAKLRHQEEAQWRQHREMQRIDPDHMLKIGNAGAVRGALKERWGSGVDPETGKPYESKTVKELVREMEGAGLTRREAFDVLRPYQGMVAAYQHHLGKKPAEIIGRFLVDVHAASTKELEGATPEQLKVYQVVNLLTGKEEHPTFDTMVEAGKWLREYVKSRPAFEGDPMKADPEDFAAAVADTAAAEIIAWRKISPHYKSFYGKDISDTNQGLHDWVKQEYKRAPTKEEEMLLHMLGSAASGNATPSTDTQVAFRVLERYLRTGELEGKQEDGRPAQQWRKGKEAFDADENPILKDEAGQVSKTFQLEQLEGLKRISAKLGGLDKAMEWLAAKHSWEEILEMTGKRPGASKRHGEDGAQLKPHENLSREADQESFGIFGLQSMKQGSYTLNRWGELSTVTHDLWIARWAERLTGGENLIVDVKKTKKNPKGEGVMTLPWTPTLKAGGLKARAALAEGYRRAGKQLGLEPAEVQEAVWDIEQMLWGKLVKAKPAAGYASEGLQRGIERFPQRQVNTAFSGIGTVEAVFKNLRRGTAVEFDPKIQAAYNAGHGAAHKPQDILKVDPAAYKDAGFHASPICKNLSKAKRSVTPEDRASDLRHGKKVAEIITTSEPPTVTIENVPGYRNEPAFKAITKALDSKGYTWDVVIVNAKDLGAPQVRTRMILRAVKEGQLPKLPKGFVKDNGVWTMTGKKRGGDWWAAVTKHKWGPQEPKSKKDGFRLPRWERERIQLAVDKGEIDLTKPFLTMGGSASDSNVPVVNRGGPAPTLLSNNSVPRVVIPKQGTRKPKKGQPPLTVDQVVAEAEVYRLTPRMMATLQGMPTSFKIPTNWRLAKTVLGNGIQGKVTEKILEPVHSGVADAEPEASEGRLFQKAPEGKIPFEGGEMTVYHGGTGKLDPTRPMFFTEAQKDAEWFGGERGGKSPTIVKARVTIKNPADGKTLREIAAELGITEAMIEKQIGAFQGDLDFMYEPRIRAELKARGFDGVIDSDALENTSIMAAIPLEASQIKELGRVSGVENHVAGVKFPRLAQTQPGTIKGWTDFIETDGAPRARIAITKAGDVSTAIHEFAHATMWALPRTELAAIAKAVGMRGDIQNPKDWTRDQLEAVAEGLEAYFTKGALPNDLAALPAFSRLAQGMQRIYATTPQKEIPKGLRSAFDRWFGATSLPEDHPMKAGKAADGPEVQAWNAHAGREHRENGRVFQVEQPGEAEDVELPKGSGRQAREAYAAFDAPNEPAPKWSGRQRNLGQVIEALENAAGRLFLEGNLGRAKEAKATNAKAQGSVVRLRHAGSMRGMLHALGWGQYPDFVRAVRGAGGWDKVGSQLVNLGKEMYGETPPQGGFARAGFGAMMEQLGKTGTVPPYMKEALSWYNRFLNSDPKLRDLTWKALRAVKDYREQGAANMADQNLTDKERPNPVRRLRQWVKKSAYREWVDDDIDIYRYSRELEAVHDGELTGWDNPETVARAIKGTGSGRAVDAYRNGVPDPRFPFNYNARTSPGITNDVLPLVREYGRYKGPRLLGVYLWARRAAERWNAKGEAVGRLTEDQQDAVWNLKEGSPEQQAKLKEFFGEGDYVLREDSDNVLWAFHGGKDPGMSPSHAEYLVKELDAKYPNLALAATKTYKFGRALLRYRAAMGAMTPEEVRQAIRESKSWVPLRRVMSDVNPQELVADMQGGGDPFRKQRGSWRRVRNPLFTLAEYTGQTMQEIERRTLANSIFKGAKAHPELAHWAHPVDAARAKEAFNLGQIREQLAKVGVETDGVSDHELITMWVVNQKGEPAHSIYPVVDPETGKREFMWVEPNLYKAMSGQGTHTDHGQLWNISRFLNRQFKTGTTGLRPVFNWWTNPARDYKSYAVQDQRLAGESMFTAPIKRIPHYLATSISGARELMPMVPDGEWHKLARFMGLDISVVLGQDRPETRRFVRAQYPKASAKDPLNAIADRVIRNPADAVDWIREKLQATEIAPRAASMRRYLRSLGIKDFKTLEGKEGWAVALEAMRRFREVTVDFNKMGSKMRQWNQIVPFFNVRVQGPRSNLRAWKRDPAGTLVASLMTATVPALINWWQNKDEDWWRRMPWSEKYLADYVQIDGELLAIPFSQEVDSYAKIPMLMALEYAYTQDPRAIKEGIGTIFDNWEPSTLAGAAWEATGGFGMDKPNLWRGVSKLPLPQPATPLMEGLGNMRGHSGIPIDSRGELDQHPRTRFNEYTQKWAIQVGDWFNISPKKVQHVLHGITGPLGRDILERTPLGSAASSAEMEREPFPWSVVGKRGGTGGVRDQKTSDLYELDRDLQLEQNDPATKSGTPAYQKILDQRLIIGVAKELLSDERAKLKPGVTYSRGDRNRVRAKARQLVREAWKHLPSAGFNRAHWEERRKLRRKLLPAGHR